MSPPFLEVEVTVQRGGFRLQAGFLMQGGVTALFGPSGCGKTTLLQMIGGHLRPDRGRILLEGRDLTRTPPHRRPFGMVFQEPRLFPHLSVRQNLLFGRWFAPRSRNLPEPGPILEILGLTPFLQRRPRQLSGGEKARVALGRALLAGPALLLLDEPFAALDAARRAEILPMLEALRDHAGTAMLYVSHQAAETARLADQVVRLEAGRVVAIGEPAALLAAAEAQESGLALATVLTAMVQEPGGGAALAVLAHPAGVLRLPLAGLVPGVLLKVLVPAHAVTLALPGGGSGSSLRSRLQAAVLALEPDPVPSLRQVRLQAGPDQILVRITAEAAVELGLQPGMAVEAWIKSAALVPG